jgi:hypothetical protein
MKTCVGVDVRHVFSWPLHWLEVSGQIHAPASLRPDKETLVPIS